MKTVYFSSDRQPPGEKTRATLTPVESDPLRVLEHPRFTREAQGVPDFGQGSKRNIEEATEVLDAAARRSLDDVHGGGKRGTASLRCQPVALLDGEASRNVIDGERELVDIRATRGAVRRAGPSARV